MYESIYKNNELENEVRSNMSYFWYSDGLFPHNKQNAKFISASKSCITLCLVMRGFPGSFSSMNWIAVCHLVGEKSCWNGNVIACAKI